MAHATRAWWSYGLAGLGLVSAAAFAGSSALGWTTAPLPAPQAVQKSSPPVSKSTSPPNASTAPAPGAKRTVPITGADAARLAEQAAFGPTPALLAEIKAGGSAWIDAQLVTPATGYAPIAPIPNDFSKTCPVGSPPTCARDHFSAFPVRRQFFINAIHGRDQLRQRVALAYSQIFVTSAVQIGPAYAIRDYQQMLLNDAFVNFRQILKDVTLSPVMGDYLNMANNNKGNPAKGISPNENYAREVMQLFSIGPNELHPDGSPVLSAGLPVPTYTQDTVEGFAATFTGWTYPLPTPTNTAPTKNNYAKWFSAPMQNVAAEHDEGTKLLLNGVTRPGGQSAEADLEAALDNIFNHPNVGPFIGRQLIQFLVTSNPSPAYVGRITAVFDNDGNGTRGNMAAVIKAILMDPEARGPSVSNPNFGKLREPAVDVAAVFRALNAQTDGVYPAAISAHLGEPLFGPQTVFSFYPPSYPLPGSATLVAPQFGILTTASAIGRLNFIEGAVFAKDGVVAAPDSTVPGATGTKVSLNAYLPGAANPARLVDTLNTDLLQGAMPGDEAHTITGAVNAVQASAASLPLERTQMALYLVLASPRYQVTR